MPTAYHSPIRARAHAGASCIALETMQARPPLCALHVTNNIRQCRWVVQESPGEHFIASTSPDLLALPDECQHANHTWGELNRESLQVGLGLVEARNRRSRSHHTSPLSHAVTLSDLHGGSSRKRKAETRCASRVRQAQASISTPAQIRPKR